MAILVSQPLASKMCTISMGTAAIVFSRTPEGMLCPPVPSTHPVGYSTDCIRNHIMGAVVTAFLKLGSSEFAVELRNNSEAGCFLSGDSLGRLILLAAPPPPTAQVEPLGG